MHYITFIHTQAQKLFIHSLLYIFIKIVVFLSLLFTLNLLLFTHRYKFCALTCFNILQHTLAIYLGDPRHPSLSRSTPNQHWQKNMFTSTFLSSLISTRTNGSHFFLYENGWKEPLRSPALLGYCSRHGRTCQTTPFHPNWKTWL